MRTWLRIISLIEAAVLLAGLVVLIRLRPEWPQLPSSLSAPITTTMVQQLVLGALWLSTALLLLLFLGGSIVATATRPPRLPLPPPPADGLPSSRRRGLTHARRAAVSSGPVFPPPFPLIVRGGSSPMPDQNERRRSPHETKPHAAEPEVRVSILGPLEIATKHPRDRVLRSLTQQLIVYLALHRNGAITDELAEAVLPRLAPDTARKRIWRALSEARSELGDVIRRSGDHYVLDRATVTTDIAEFDVLLAQVDAQSGTARARLLERALSLIRGDPLAGTDYPWAASDMRHLRARIVDLLRELGELRLADGDATGALAAAEHAIAFDADNETAHRLAMCAESELGLRDAVVERYEGLCRALDTQFGLEPEQETRALYRRLLSQDATKTEASAVAR